MPQNKSNSIKFISIVEKYSSKFVKIEVLEKENINNPNPAEMIAAGTINVLAMGYRGVEMWRKNRIPLSIKEEKKDDEKKD